MDADGKLLDFQINAAYRRAAAADADSFLVSADMQWGDSANVAAPALSFVSLMNAIHASGHGPEFIIMAGDIVDGQFGSAGSFWSVLFGSAENYTRDFLQAWLVLAALRVPIYLIPGNHDGYRFEGAVGEFSSDGLLLFQSTFGPLYHALDRPPWRFMLLNSYDLPEAQRTIRRGEGSNIIERFSERLNVLNWGAASARRNTAGFDISLAWTAVQRQTGH
jgi:Calcineurin-like phosphoesterase